MEHTVNADNYADRGGRSDNMAGYLSQVAVADCLEMTAKLPAGALDLVYIDPPYFTKRDFMGEHRDNNGKNGDSSTKLQFTDRWQGGRSEYLHWLEERVVAIHRVLRPGGVFLLHLDWHVVHYAKVLCDQIYGETGFQNELIWYYQTGGASKGRFSRKHDTILFYAKSGENGGEMGHYFDGKAIAIPRGAGAMKRAQCPTGARLRITDTHKNPDDVLLVPALNPMAIERTGYPTQKPLALLEKLILGLCPPEGIVGDFFCGSGTTLVAAKSLGRRYLGCDSNPAAVAVARRRLGGGVDHW